MEKKEKRPWKVIKLLIGLIIIAAAVVAASKYFSRNKVLNFSATVDSKLEAIQELAVYTYTYSDYKVNENARELLGISMPGTTNTVVVLYEGTIKVGYDLSKADVSVDDESKIISITLPEVSVIDNYINTDSIQTYEINNIFNPITNGDFVSILQEERQRHLEEAEEKGIYDLAEAHAKKVITTLFAAFDDYQVEFVEETQSTGS